MGLRSRISKVFGTETPADIVASADAQGMGTNTAFSPGSPIGPYDGYSRTPRQFDFQTGFNINTRPRSTERISFSTLKSLAESYDVAQMCIWHRIDSIRSLGWNIIPAAGVEGDIDDQIKRATQIMKRPDTTTPFGSWLPAYLYDVLAYDAGTLSRVRNNAGNPIGLRTVDGTTIAPLIDGWGDTPKPPAEAYVQYANGVPWGWLTTDDLIYIPFRPKNDSPYGTAPLETILLNANTDLRFQAYFLQKFTDGNVPAAFMMAPETWTPSQIQEMQAAWDAYMLGDQSKMQQIRWIPGGTGVAWSNDKEFSDLFSLFLMRKTAAAFHVTPQDLGFTEDVNHATSDTQSDNQFRVGDLPLIQHCQGIFTDFLQSDMGLPVEFQFDTGREKEDRLQTAQSDDLYVKMGAVSLSEVRERVFGLAEPDGQIVPRFIFTTRDGPIPLSALNAVAGPVDMESGAPLPGAPLPSTVFQPVQGVAPSPPEPTDPLAVQQSGLVAVPPAPLTAAPVAKTETVGVTAETGMYASPMLADPDNDGDAVEVEKAQFQRFARQRRRTGTWRDFTFTHTDRTVAHRLNDAGRATVRKDAGQLVAAGLCVRAADTGRVLMLQRALDPADPAGGTWEFPGGHIEDGEEPLAAAWREWQEEVGCLLDSTTGQMGGGWGSLPGIYQGFVWIVPSEASIPLRARDQVTNPDDPDGDIVEAIAWFDPAHLAGNPALRPELAADLDLVHSALGIEPVGVVKAAPGDPKGSWRDDPADTPHQHFDLTLTDHYTPLVQAAIGQLWTSAQLAAAISTTDTVVKSAPPLPDPDTAHLDALIRQIIADAFLAGAHAGTLQLGTGAVQIDVLRVSKVDWSNWTAGHPAAALLTTDGRIAELLAEADVTVKGIVGTTLRELGNAIADGLAAGDSSDTIAASLGGIVDDVSRAEMIAHTETARAMTAASLNVYSVNGVGQWDLVTSGGACPTCLGIASTNPHPLADTGDAAPVHPRCRCAVSPVVESIGAG